MFEFRPRNLILYIPLYPLYYRRLAATFSLINETIFSTEDAKCLM